MSVSIDFETMPDENLLSSLPEPEVKYGNTKDPEKRAKMDEEAKLDQIEKIALNPFYSRICSAAYSFKPGFGNDFYNVIESSSDAEEIHLVERAFHTINDTLLAGGKIITWNGTRFDLPFLFVRAMLLKVDVSPVEKFSKLCRKYNTDFHVDVAMVLSNWEPKIMRLNDVARRIIGKEKIDLDFKLFPELIKTKEGRDQIGIYNLTDSQLTMEIYSNMERYF